MKEQIFPELYTIIIFGIVLILFLIYIAYFMGKQESFSDTYLLTKILLYSCLALFVLFIFALEIMVIYITQGNETGTESWIFLIMNALLIGMYINLLGFRKRTGNPLRYLMIFILVYISLSGFGYLGILIEFRSPVSDYLLYRYFQSNSTHGILFMSFNILLLTLIYFISFTTESEIS